MCVHGGIGPNISTIQDILVFVFVFVFLFFFFFLFFFSFFLFSFFSFFFLFFFLFSFFIFHFSFLSIFFLFFFSLSFLIFFFYSSLSIPLPLPKNKDINRFESSEMEGKMAEILWSDPITPEEHPKLSRSDIENFEFRDNHVRGCGFFFGRVSAIEFVERNDLRFFFYFYFYYYYFLLFFYFYFYCGYSFIFKKDFFLTKNVFFFFLVQL